MDSSNSDIEFLEEIQGTGRQTALRFRNRRLIRPNQGLNHPSPPPNSLPDQTAFPQVDLIPIATTSQQTSIGRREQKKKKPHKPNQYRITSTSLRVPKYSKLKLKFIKRPKSA